MKRKGFTLMELLLVVAILALTSAAAAPTFSSGSADAIEQARRSNFYSAYQKAVFGANLMMALGMANYTKTSKDHGIKVKGEFFPRGLTLDANNQWIVKVNGKEEKRNLNYYIPISSRVFYSLYGREFFVSAKIGPNQSIVYYWVDTGYNTHGGQRPDLDHYHGSADIQSGLTGTGNNVSYVTTYDHQEIHLSNTRSLDDIWDEIKNKK